MSTAPAASYVHMPPADGVWWGNRQLLPLLVPVERLREDPENLNQHGEFNVRTIAASLREHGQQGITIVRPDGTMVGGSGTLRAVTDETVGLGWTHIAAMVFEGPKDEADILAMRLNRTGELSTWDYERVGQKLGLWRDVGMNMDELGWRQYEVDSLAGATFLEDIGDMPDAEATGRAIKVNHQQRQVFDEAWAAMRLGADDLSQGEAVERLARDWLDIHAREFAS